MLDGDLSTMTVSVDITSADERFDVNTEDLEALFPWIEYAFAECS